MNRMEHVGFLTLAELEHAQKVAKKELRFVDMVVVEQARTKKQRKWIKAHAVLGQIGGNGRNHMELVEYSTLAVLEHVQKVAKKELRFVSMVVVGQVMIKKPKR